jgi:hypothetical protein
LITGTPGLYTVEQLRFIERVFGIAA